MTNDQKLLNKLARLQTSLQKAEQLLKDKHPKIRTKAMVVELAKVLQNYNHQLAILQQYDYEIATPTYPYLEKCLKAVKAKKATKPSSTPQPKSSSAEEIDCATFVSAVSKWHVEMKKFFKKNKAAYTNVQIATKKFAANLSDNVSPLPIVANLYQEWQALLNGLEGERTGNQLFEILLSSTSSTWTITGDLKALEAHYKQHKKAYKKYESSMESFRDEEMPKQQFFLDALKASTSADDPNLPEARAEVEQDRKEALSQLEKDYKNWLHRNTEQLSNIDSTEEGKAINKKELSANRMADMLAPNYAQAFWNETGQAIEQAVLSASGTVSYRKATKIAIKILGEQYKKHVTRAFLQHAIDSNSSASLPLGLEDWLRTSIDKNEQSYKSFASQWQDWCQQTANVVALCENKMEGKTYTIDLAKLHQELEQKFKYEVNGKSSGSYIWQQLKTSLPQDKTAKFDDLNTAWQNGVETLQKDAFTRNLWADHLTSGAENQHLEQAVANFFAKAPSKEALVNALWDARYHAPKSHVPSQKHPLRGAFKVQRSNGQQGFDFLVNIPLTFQQAPNHSGQPWQHAIPSKKASDYFIEITDSLSYEIDKSSLKVVSHAPTFSVKEGLFEARTGVTLYLSVRDTSSRRVVKAGGAGKVNLLSLDSTALGQLGSKLKKAGISTDFLKTGVDISLVGNAQAEVGEVVVEVTLLGFPVIAHYYPDREWPANLKLESPNLLAHRKAELLDSYGSQTYDISFYAEVYSVRYKGTDQHVSVENGREGSVTWDSSGEVSGREDLKVEFVGGDQHKILLTNK